MMEALTGDKRLTDMIAELGSRQQTGERLSALETLRARRLWLAHGRGVLRQVGFAGVVCPGLFEVKRGYIPRTLLHNKLRTGKASPGLLSRSAAEGSFIEKCTPMLQAFCKTGGEKNDTVQRTV